jgi:hypothetical protein
MAKRAGQLRRQSILAGSSYYGRHTNQEFKLRISEAHVVDLAQQKSVLQRKKQTPGKKWHEVEMQQMEENKKHLGNSMFVISQSSKLYMGKLIILTLCYVLSTITYAVFAALSNGLGVEDIEAKYRLSKEEVISLKYR